MACSQFLILSSVVQLCERMNSRLVAVAAEQYSPRRLNPKWKEVVFSILPKNRLMALEDCGSLYRLWTCKENPEHKFVTRIGCKDPDCYVCSFAKKQEQVADRMEVLDRIYSELHEQIASSMFTFTTPSVMWQKIEDSPDSISYLEEFVREVLLEYSVAKGVFRWRGRSYFGVMWSEATWSVSGFIHFILIERGMSGAGLMPMFTLRCIL